MMSKMSLMPSRRSSGLLLHRTASKNGNTGFEDLKNFIKDGGDFAKEVAAILEERAELEAVYSKVGSNTLTCQTNVQMCKIEHVPLFRGYLSWQPSCSRRQKRTLGQSPTPGTLSPTTSSRPQRFTKCMCTMYMKSMYPRKEAEYKDMYRIPGGKTYFRCTRQWRRQFLRRLRSLSKCSGRSNTRRGKLQKRW